MSDPRLSHEPRETGMEAWIQRYKQRFVERAGLSAEQAEACAQAEPFHVLSEGFEDDPEGAADEEMSYWDADEDADE